MIIFSITNLRSMLFHICFKRLQRQSFIFFLWCKGQQRRGNWFPGKMLLNNQVTPHQFARGFSSLYQQLQSSRSYLCSGSLHGWILYSSLLAFKEVFSLLPRCLIPNPFNTFPLFLNGTKVVRPSAPPPVNCLSKYVYPLNE